MTNRFPASYQPLEGGGKHIHGHCRSEQEQFLDRHIRRRQQRQPMAMEDRARAVTAGITDDRVGMSMIELSERCRRQCRAAGRLGGQAGEGLDLAPNRGGRHAESSLHQRIGDESAGRALPLHDAAEGLEDTRLPDEIDRIDAARFPYLAVRDHMIESIRLADQTAVRPEHHAQRVTVPLRLL